MQEENKEKSSVKKKRERKLIGKLKKKEENLTSGLKKNLIYITIGTYDGYLFGFQVKESDFSNPSLKFSFRAAEVKFKILPILEFYIILVGEY